MIPTAPIAASTLFGGYAVARATKKRGLGGLVMAGGSAWCLKRWLTSVGAMKSVGLLGVLLGGFGASHPLAKKIGAWPSVASVAALAAGASWLLADRNQR